MDTNELFTFACDRCDTGTTGTIDELIAPEYIVDDPHEAVGFLCPDCAIADDPHHIEDSWLLSWAG